MPTKGLFKDYYHRYYFSGPERGVSSIMQISLFDVPVPPSTESDSKHPDKAELRRRIFEMRAQGMSYREIGAALGIHWTRVGQILKASRQ